MENENNDDYLNYNEDKDNIFELDFSKQRIENNTNYQNWKKK